MTTKTRRRQRQEVPKENTWKLDDLFVSRADWEAALQEVQKDVINVTQYKGQLGKSASVLVDCLTALEQFENKVIHVATYASLRTRDRKSVV